MDHGHDADRPARKVARRDASLRERLDYLESGLATELGLREAVRRLGLQGLKAEEPCQRDRLEVRIRRLETACDDVHDDLISYLSRDGKLRRLASADSEMIRARAQQLIGLPSDSVPYEILEIAKELVEAWGLAYLEAEARGSPESASPSEGHPDRIESERPSANAPPTRPGIGRTA
ncbi:MAG: hypothetical protein OEU54_00450 [Gemmatimonadota bacterium]|nr:hypothetical protein [Gemmatimonadota bacterium]